MTQIEYRIVELLSRNAGRIMTYDMIMKQIWGPTIAQDHQVLRAIWQTFAESWSKIQRKPIYIRTEIGVGYWMAEDE